jgi:hypothetical protein
MNTNLLTRSLAWKARISLAILAGVIVTSVTACSHLAMGKKAPGADEFGLGPRTSAHGLYTATLQPQAPLRPRRLQMVSVELRDAGGRPVDGAAIKVDGGMPQHGHGLPTQPRVTRNLEGGVYQIEGVRFNMGGWWEFTLAINSAAGPDQVTFNLAL